MAPLRISDLFNRAWNRIRDNLALVVGLTVVYGLASAVCTAVPVVGGFLVAALYPGYLMGLLRIQQQQTLDFQDFFWSFQDVNRFIHVILGSFLISLFLLVGFVCLIVPGIYLSVALCLAPLTIVYVKTDAIDSLKTSRDLIEGHWWFVGNFLFAVTLINLAGFVSLLVGLLISIPVSTLMHYELMLALQERKKVTVL
jgi:hypothetical protein